MSGYANRIILSLSRGGLASVMASGILSISAFHHGFFLLSIILYICAIVLFSVIVVPSFWLTRDLIWRNSDYRWKFNRFTFVSGIAVILSRTMIIHISPVMSYLSLVLMISDLAAVISFLAIELSENTIGNDSSHFSQLNLGVSVAASLVALDLGVGSASNIQSGILLLIAIFSMFLAIFLYLAFVYLNLRRFLTGNYSMENVDGTLWIAMGLPALISVSIITTLSAFPSITGVLLVDLDNFAEEFWVLATCILIPVTIISIIKVRRTERIRYHPSLWAVIFPTGVYSLDTTFLSQILLNRAIYDFSVAVDIASSSLFVVFLFLLMLTSIDTNYNNQS